MRSENVRDDLGLRISGDQLASSTSLSLTRIVCSFSSFSKVPNELRSPLLGQPLDLRGTLIRWILVAGPQT